MFQNNTNSDNKSFKIYKIVELSNFLVCYIFRLYYFDDNYLHEGRVKCDEMNLYGTNQLGVPYNYSTDRNIENTSKENFNISIITYYL